MKQKLIKLMLIILVLVFNWLIFGDQLIAAYQSYQGKNLIREVKIGRRWQNFEKLRTEALEFSGWSENNKIDLALDSGARGVAVYRFERLRNAGVVIFQPGLTLPEKGSNRISISTDQNQWEVLVENQSLYRVPINISDIARDRPEFFVKIEAETGSGRNETTQILYDLHLMYYDHEFIFPNIPVIFASAVIPILIIFRPRVKSWLKIALVLGVLFWSLSVGWKNFISYGYHSFDSDVYCLMKEVPRFNAQDFPNNILSTYCGNKESGILLVMMGFWRLFGTGSEIGIRMPSLIFHILTVIFTLWYGIKIKSFTAGLIAAWFVGTHAYLIDLSGRGLRDTVFTFLVLIFTYFVFTADFRKIYNKVAVAMIGVATIFFRLHSLVQFLVFLLPLGLIYKKNSLKNLIFAGSVLLIAAAPLINFNLKTYGVWNFSESMHLKWNRNVEFSGQPGFLSKEEERKNPYQGPEISALNYFFKLHSFKDLAMSSIAGIRNSFTELYFKSNLLGLFLFTGGSILMLRKKRYAYIPILVFFLEIPHFFLLGKGLVEYRSMTQSLPFIGLTMGYIIDRLWIKLKI